jgi:hypothetical protein
MLEIKEGLNGGGRLTINVNDPMLFDVLMLSRKKLIHSLDEKNRISASDYKLSLRLTLEAVGSFPVRMELDGDDRVVELSVDKFVVTDITLNPSSDPSSTPTGTY